MVSEVRMTSRSQKGVPRDDLVTRKAKALNLTPESLFVQAYLRAGNEMSTGERHFKNQYYPGTGELKFKIPKIVENFCNEPIPSCENPNCSHDSNGKKPPFTMGLPNGILVYYCSSECKKTDEQEAVQRVMLSRSERRELGDEVFRVVCQAMSNAELVTVPEELIRFMPNQPRRFFDQLRLQSLANSMLLAGPPGRPGETVTGQLMPGYLRSIPKDENGCIYELLDGQRRLMAVRLAGIPVYRALLVQLDEESARHVVSVMANFNREGHTPLELSDTISHMHDEFGFSFAKIADIVGKSVVRVQDMYRLRLLVPSVRELLDPERTPKRSRLSVGAAVQIAKLEPARQVAQARLAIENDMRITEVTAMVHGQTTNAGSGRAISSSERLRSLQAQVRRMPPAVAALQNAITNASEAKAFDLVDAIEVEEWLSTVTEAVRALQKCEEEIRNEHRAKSEL